MRVTKLRFCDNILSVNVLHYYYLLQKKNLMIFNNFINTTDFSTLTNQRVFLERKLALSEKKDLNLISLLSKTEIHAVCVP